jgi:hypothetical protein
MTADTDRQAAYRLADAADPYFLDAATAWVILTALANRLAMGFPLDKAVNDALAESRSESPEEKLRLAELSAKCWREFLQDGASGATR